MSDPNNDDENVERPRTISLRQITRRQRDYHWRNRVNNEAADEMAGKLCHAIHVLQAGLGGR
jgi:hypothetical protein